MDKKALDAASELLKAVRYDEPAALAALQSVHNDHKRLLAPHKQFDTPIIIDVQSVSKQYTIGRQKISALNAVNLQVHEGEFVALTGKSGSGKSTLLQIIGGLDKPDGGMVRIDNTNMTALSDNKLSTFRNKTIGFVFQFFYLQPFLKLRTNLEVPAMFAHMPTENRKARIAELADAVGLTERLDHLPKELSGGQMQRVAIARALFNRPKILLADEPTGNLDSANGAAIMELFEHVRQEFGTTIVMVTHDHSIARRADRIVTLKDGEIMA